MSAQSALKVEIPDGRFLFGESMNKHIKLLVKILGILFDRGKETWA